jgi:hypothetical protein
MESVLYHFQLSFTSRKVQYLRAGLIGHGWAVLVLSKLRLELFASIVALTK